MVLDSGIQIWCRTLVHTACNTIPVEPAWPSSMCVHDPWGHMDDVSGLRLAICGAGWEQVCCTASCVAFGLQPMNMCMGEAAPKPAG